MKRILAATALIALAAGTAQAEFKTPAIDGTGITAANNGPSLALQTATPGFGPTLQLGEVFVSNDGTNLYVSFAGNNDNGGSGIYLFLNTVAGGATNIAANPSYGEFDDLADVGGGNMPAGFGVDYILNLKRPAEGGSIGLWNLATNTAQFIGNSGSYTLGFDMAQDNSNATNTPWASGTVTTGVEVQIPLSQIGNPGPGDVIQFFAIAGNNNKGGNGGNYMSNQLLPNVGTPPNYGSDGSGGGGGGAPGLNYNGTGGPNVVPLAYTVKAYGVPYAATGPGISTVGIGGTYSTLKAALEAATTAGSRDGSQWVFEILNNLTEPTNISLNLTVDPAGSIVVRPAPGTTPTVTFTTTADNAGASGHIIVGGSLTSSTIGLLPTRNVIFDGNNGTIDRALTFQNTAALTLNNQSLITVIGNSDGAIIRNMRILNLSAGTGAANAAIRIRAQAGAEVPDNFQIINNYLQSNQTQGHGVNIQQGAAPTSGTASTDWLIQNNDIVANLRGVFLSPATNGTIHANRMSIGYGTGAAGFVNFGVLHNGSNGGASNLVVSNNVIDIRSTNQAGVSGSTGFQTGNIGAGSTQTVVNNTIRIRNVAAAPGAISAKGIMGTSQANYVYHHNTIDIEAANPPAAGIISPAFVTGIQLPTVGSANVAASNNIINVKIPGGSAYYRVAAPTTGTYTINDNLINVVSGPIATNLRQVASTSATRASTGTTRTVTLSVNHGLTVGDTVHVAYNNNAATARLYEGTFTVDTIPSALSFTYTASTPLTEAAVGSQSFTITALNTAHVDLSTPALWQIQAWTPDAISTFADPGAALNSNDLHLVSTGPDVTATAQVGGLTTDIDGQARSATPNRGADEFSVNVAPTAVNAGVTVNSSVNENANDILLITGAFGVDPDVNDFPIITASVPQGAVTVARSNMSQYAITLTSPVDFETAPTLPVTLTATDRGGLTVQTVVNITINDVNEVPTDITLSNNTITEGPSGTPVGTLSAVDPDAGDTHTFALVAGAGDTDNASFQITGSTLLTNAVLGTGAYSVRVQATDAGSLTFSRSFTINIESSVQDWMMLVD